MKHTVELTEDDIRAAIAAHLRTQGYDVGEVTIGKRICTSDTDPTPTVRLTAEAVDDRPMTLAQWIEELLRRRAAHGHAVVTDAEATDLRAAIAQAAGGIQPAPLTPPAVDGGTMLGVLCGVEVWLVAPPPAEPEPADPVWDDAAHLGALLSGIHPGRGEGVPMVRQHAIARVLRKSVTRGEMRHHQTMLGEAADALGLPGSPSWPDALERMRELRSSSDLVADHRAHQIDLAETLARGAREALANGERARIVAWLRRPHGSTPAGLPLTWPLDLVADMIERGDVDEAPAQPAPAAVPSPRTCAVACGMCVSRRRSWGGPRHCDRVVFGPGEVPEGAVCIYGPPSDLQRAAGLVDPPAAAALAPHPALERIAADRASMEERAAIVAWLRSKIWTGPVGRLGLDGGAFVDGANSALEEAIEAITDGEHHR